MDNLTQKSLKVTAFLIVLVSVILIFLQKFSWALGFLTAGVWSMLNFLATMSLLKIAVLEKSKAKLSLVLLVKFPLLYLIGFLVLVSGKFPVSSLLAGLAPIFLVTGVLRIWPQAK